METKKITLNKLRTLVKHIIKEEIKNNSVEDQKTWSDKKSKMYDAYVDAHNKIEDLKDELKRAKNRKDSDDIKRINLRIKNLEFAKKASKEEFDKL
jgi:hypothetical protein